MTVGIDLRESPVAIGSMVSKYRIEKVIGRGGYAWVFRATDTFLGREVAVKILHRNGGVTPEMLRRGQAEARLLIKLRHPNIVDTFDAGMTEDGLLFIVMELLVGRSLFEALREYGRLTEHEAVPIFLQVAEAVAHAHSIGAIHRDLKPENIFVTESGDAKVLDFGIAKITDDGVPITTKKDVWLGTVLYMSPEQVQGAHVAFGSDIYSLGMVYWEALGGIHPFLTDCEAPTPVAMGMMHVTKIPPPIHKFRTDVPKELSRIVDRAISKKVDERYLTAADFAAALRDYQQQRALQLGEAKPKLRKLAGEVVDGGAVFAPVPSTLQRLPTGRSKSLPPPNLAETAVAATPETSRAESSPTKQVVKRTLKGVGDRAEGMAQLPTRDPATALVASPSQAMEPVARQALVPAPPQRTPPALSRLVAPRRSSAQAVAKPVVKRLGWFQALLIGGGLGAAAFGAATVGMYSLKAKRAPVASDGSAAILAVSRASAAPSVPESIASSPPPRATVQAVELPPVTPAKSAAAGVVAARPAVKPRRRDRLDEKLKALDAELSNSYNATAPKVRNESPE